MIDRFQLLEFCGEGAGGSVYRASDPELARDVALKFLIQSPRTESDDYQRFLREGKVLSTFTHPNLAKVYGVGIWNGKPYLVMEFIKGTSLRTLLNQGRLSQSSALNIIGQVGSGISVVHKQGVVHRDLKPENIMVQLNEHGCEQAKVIDFGLSMLLDSEQQITSTGTLIGTAQYMSPEQCLGMRSSQQSDIYALGCIFYEMLTGLPPFQADNHVALLNKHVNETATTISKVDRSLAPFDGVLKKALAKSPHDRFITVEDFLEELNSAASQTVKAPTKPLPAWLPVSVTMVCLAGAASYIAVGAPQSSPLTARVIALTPPPTACSAYVTLGDWYSGFHNWTDAATMYTTAREIQPEHSKTNIPDLLAQLQLTAKQAEALQKSGQREQAVLVAYEVLGQLIKYTRLESKTKPYVERSIIHESINAALNVLEANPVNSSRLRHYEVNENFWAIGSFLHGLGLYNDQARICTYRTNIGGQAGIELAHCYVIMARLAKDRNDLEEYILLQKKADEIFAQAQLPISGLMVYSWVDLAALADTVDHPDASRYIDIAISKARLLDRGANTVGLAALLHGVNQARLGNYHNARKIAEQAKSVIAASPNHNFETPMLKAIDEFLALPNRLDEKTRCAKLLVMFADIEMRQSGNYLRCGTLLQRAEALTTDKATLTSIMRARQDCESACKKRLDVVDQPSTGKRCKQ